MVQIRPLFVYFRSFRMTNTAQIDYNDKSVDGVHGMVGADESTDLIL